MKRMSLWLAMLILATLLVITGAGCSKTQKAEPSTPAAASASLTLTQSTPSASQGSASSPKSSGVTSAAPSAKSSGAATAAPAKNSSTAASAASSADTRSNTSANPSSPVSHSTASASGVPSSSASPNPGMTGAVDYFVLGDVLMQSESIGSVKVNMPESELVKLLGQPNSKSTPVLSAADGLQHSTWVYDTKGLQLNMAKKPAAAQTIVYSLLAKAPCTMATKRGIKLGDTKEAVMKAYADSIDPKANTNTSSRIVIGSVYGGIVVTIVNGTVKDIFIGASAE